MVSGKQRVVRRRRRRKGGGALVACVVVAGLLFAGCLLWMHGMLGAAAHDAEGAPAGASVELDGFPRLYSEYFVLERASGDVLASAGADERIRPASMTKIMTVLVAIEAADDLDAPVTVTNDDFAGLYEANASLAGFQPGEETTVRALLYGAFLPSGAECCQALARVTAGSEDAFVALMNERAAELGMDGTQFSNVTGLDEDGHYTTVADMATLLRAGLENDTFRQILATGRYSVSPTNQHEGGFTFYSTLSQALPSYDVPGGRIIGGKTGFTEGAGLCLASAAEIDGEVYVLVTAHAPGAQDSGQHAQDAVAVYTWLGAGRGKG